MIKTKIDATTSKQVTQAVLASLGVSPERWNDLMSLSLQSGYWRVELARRDENGALVIVRETKGVRGAVEVYEVVLDHSEDSTPSG